MKLIACQACSRPYDVRGFEAGTRLSCICGEGLVVGASDPVAGGVICGHCGAPVPEGRTDCTHCEVKLLTRRCPDCGVTSPDGSVHCRGCGKALVCQGLKPLPENRECPRCKEELGIRVFPNGSTIECPSCHGLWLEPGDLERMATKAAAGPPPASNEVEQPKDQPVAYLPCVRCGELMQRRVFEWERRPTGVVLDHCGNHGVWLDGGELAAILAKVRSGGGKPMAAPEPRSTKKSSSGGAGSVGRASESTWWGIVAVEVAIEALFSAF